MIFCAHCNGSFTASLEVQAQDYTGLTNLHSEDYFLTIKIKLDTEGLGREISDGRRLDWGRGVEHTTQHRDDIL